MMLPMKKEEDETELVRELKLVAGLTVKIDEPLARYTTMKIGGPADYFLDVETNQALLETLRLLDARRIPIGLVGKGSNVLVSDRGIRGAVLRLGGEFKRISWHEEGAGALVDVGAAYAVAQLVREAARRGYAGLEFAEGIPGSVGGALVMNAGAYGSEMEKIVAAVEGVTVGGKAVRFPRDEIVFTYRESHLPSGTVVTAARLRLEKKDAEDLGAKVRELVNKRKQSQPTGYPNSGSMFRNPPGDFAGRLIEAAGLKGRRIGRAEISARHANFMVNLGGARAEDGKQLMDLARSEVKNQFGVELFPEVKFLGEWPAGHEQV
jgi:UDP-N-acetylmuramate dehydrogenase